MDLNNPAILLTLLDEPDKRERLRELLVQQAKNEDILKSAKNEKEDAERVLDQANATMSDARKRHAEADERHNHLAQWEKGIANANASMQEEKDRFEAVRATVETNLSERTAAADAKEAELDKREADVAAKEADLAEREKILEAAEADHNARIQRLKDAIG